MCYKGVAAIIKQGPQTQSYKGEILAVNRITKFILCGTCKTRLMQHTEGQKRFDCAGCKTTMKRKMVKESVAFNVIFQDEESHREELSIFSDVLDPFLGITSYSLPEEVLKKAILDKDDVQIKVDMNKVIKTIEDMIEE